MNRVDVINDAIKYKGHYSNPNIFTKWYSKDNKKHVWCGMFVDYVFKHDLNYNIFDDCSNFSYVPTIVGWARKHGYWNKDYKKANSGDLIIYNWKPKEKNNYSHVEIIRQIKGDSVVSIGGNTDNGLLHNNVTIKKRNKKYISGVVILPFEKYNLNRILKKRTNGEDVKELQKELKARGYNIGKSGKNKDGIDGDFGNNTFKSTKNLQKDTGLKLVDGEVGKDTSHKSLAWTYKNE